MYTALLKDISSGRFQVGDFLPSVRELAAQFRGSISPVVRALQRLEEDGLVERIQGSGVRLAKIPGSEKFSKGAAVVVMPAVRPLEEYAVPSSTGAAMIGLEEFNRPEERLHRHVGYASQEWVIHKLLHHGDVRIQLSPLSLLDGENGFVRVLEQLLHSPPDAFCFVAPDYFSDRALTLLQQLEARRTYVAHMVTARDSGQFDRVVFDFADGQYQLTRHVLSLGHKSVIRLCAEPTFDWEKRKQQGYVKALVEAGYAVNYAGETSLSIGALNGSGAEVVGRAVRFIGAAIDRFKPTAIMAVNDSYAALVRVVLRFLGHTEILITGYDNVWEELDEPDPFKLGGLAGSFPEDLDKRNPPITVERQLPLAGTALAKLVIDRLHGRLPMEKQVILIPQMLVLPKKPAGKKAS